MQASISNKLSLLYVSVIICRLCLASTFGWHDHLVTKGDDYCSIGERKFGNIDPKCEADCDNTELKCRDNYHEATCMCNFDGGYVRNGTAGCIHHTSCPNWGASVCTCTKARGVPPCPPKKRHSNLALKCLPTCDKPNISCDIRWDDDNDCVCDFGLGFVLDEATGECVFHKDCPAKPEPPICGKGRHSRRGCLLEGS